MHLFWMSMKIVLNLAELDLGTLRPCSIRCGVMYTGLEVETILSRTASPSR
jgi:hypothetical protein